MITFSLFGRTFALGKNSNSISSWACYYGQKDETGSLSAFDLIVAAPGGQSPGILRSKGIKVLVYVSLGEVAANGPYFREAEGLGLLVRHNTDWDSWVVDVRRPEWRAMVLDRIIPDAIAEGYDGIFFDTLDSPIDMQRRDPDTYKGTERRCVELVRDIRKKYPRLLLCQNRGFEIINRTAPYLDYLLIEGLSSSMDLSTGERSDVSEDDRIYLRSKADEARKTNPNLVILSLDYVPPEDSEAVSRAIEYSLQQGFVPYVSTPALDRIFIR